jgi:hypothetical protein
MGRKFRMHVGGMRCGVVECMQLAQRKVQCVDFVNTVMFLERRDILQPVGNLSLCWGVRDSMS